MIEFLFQICSFIVVVLITAATLFGIGQLGWKLFSLPYANKIDTLTVWLGFCLIVGVIELAHLFVPIDWRASLVSVAIGLYGCSRSRKPFLLLAPRTVWRAVNQNKFYSVIATAIVLISIARAMGVPNNYDSGLYHFQSIKWINEYPIVLGLGNLHWRLALNQSYFGFLGLLNFSPYWGKGYAAGGLFLFLLTATMLFERRYVEAKISQLLVSGILSIPLFFILLSIANPTPDNGVTLLEIAVFLLFLQLSVEWSRSSELVNRLLVVMVFLCVTLITIKLSSLGYAISTMSVLVYLGFQTRTLTGRTLWVMFALIAGFVLIHISRGYLLSGAPLFPNPTGGLWSLSWAVSENVARFESALIYSWARAPGVLTPEQILSGYQWFPVWWQKLPISLKVAFVIAVCLSIFSLTKLYRKNYLIQKLKFICLFYLSIGTGFIFWFFTAPDIRFLGGLLPIFFASSVLMASGTIVWNDFSLRINTSYAVFYLAIIFILIYGVAINLKKVISVGARIQLPKVELQSRFTQSGYLLNIPIDGDQCWNVALPCTPNYHKELSVSQTVGGHILFRKSD